MTQAAPPGLDQLTLEQDATLRLLTTELSAALPDAMAERERFFTIQQRGLALPEELLADRLAGKIILVTGGTGCIGSTLLALLERYRPARLVSASRGVSDPWQRHSGVTYLTADVRDVQQVRDLVSQVQPDVIFHCAAQRDPGLAEIEVARTAATNIFGTENVLTAAAEAGVAQVTCASTGKALRPYSPDVYAASKRAAEWVATRYATGGALLVSASRFTHVADNSIIGARLAGWSADPGGVIRLHSPYAAFYVQSARESAQLLLAAFLGAQRGELRVHAIADLGWPASLLDLALGERAAQHSAVPVYLSGYDRGYEEAVYPGLYDPRTAGDVSPLLNMFEAACTVTPAVAGIDAFRLDLTAPAAAGFALQQLRVACLPTSSALQARAALDTLSWTLLDATFAAAPGALVARSAQLAGQCGSELHRRVAAVAAGWGSRITTPVDERPSVV